jgi:hypothetical protein
MICDNIFCGQKVYQVNRFISACVLSMGTVLSVSRRVVNEWTEMLKMAE